MEFFSAEGYSIYAVASLAAFVSGLIPFIILLGAAAFGGASDIWMHLFELTVCVWIVCFLVPVALIASRLKVAPWFGIVGSSAMVLYCLYWLLVVLTRHDSTLLLVGKSAIPVWLWAAAPIPFNTLHAILSWFRFKEMQGPKEETLWPQ